MSGLISRQAAIDEAEEWIEAVYCDHEEQRERDAIKHVINGIKNLPSAQPEPCEDCVSRKAVIRLLHSGYHSKSMIEEVKELPSAQPKPLTEAEIIICKLYLDDMDKYKTCNEYKLLMGLLDGKAYVQPNIIHCNECEYGCQDKYGRWFCRSLGCQIGEEDGSGYCADAERRTDEQT